ncbi:HNH endonuclease signature motif containing protein [Streptomyces californicus]|uniref:HNH endonuclease n=1 Tax=Streptomyces californicus TaxID=67351 RepID=UPI00296E595B|nr:HNH endonuclease signature motif containing protein [Streptomyces californicus]MDW4912505.1 HNH endonuclease signature motif containing protein [Streptomyces californicus]
MGRKTATTVRYRAGRANRVLRLALWEAWDSKCYWCTKPLQFSVSQIDHIIPKNVTDADLTRLKAAYGLPDSFDVQDPQNLAPICPPCNGVEGKSDSTRQAGVTMSHLAAAEKRRPAVVAHVQAFGRSGKVATHLLEAATADLSQPDIRREFLDTAPAVVQVLAMTEQGIGDYRSFREVEVCVDDEDGLWQRIDVALDDRGRLTISLLENLCASDLEDVLQDPITQLIGEMRSRVTAGFEAMETGDPITAGPPTSDFITINIDSLDFRRYAGQVEFTFEGAFEAGFAASVVRSSPDGGGTDDLQGDAMVSGTYSFVADWDLADDAARVQPGDCTVEDWDQDLSVA